MKVHGLQKKSRGSQAGSLFSFRFDSFYIYIYIYLYLVRASKFTQKVVSEREAAVKEGHLLLCLGVVCKKHRNK